MDINFFTVTSIMDQLQVKCEKIVLSVLSEKMRLQSNNGETHFLLLKVPPSDNMRELCLMNAFKAMYLF